MSKLLEARLRHKRVLLRVDFDVPMQDGQVADDFRIIASLPTFNHLLTNQAAIIVISHLGRPDGRYIPQLSLKPVIEHFAGLMPNIKISWTDEILSFNVRKRVVSIRPGEIFFLGNIRFQPDEETDNNFFAKELSLYGEIFVNDAFAVAHRHHASVHSLAQQLVSYAGFLLESEIDHLKKLVDSDRRPYVAVVGGAKIQTKILALKNLLPKIDRLLLGGAVANTFLRAAGKPVGLSLIDFSEIALADELLEEFKEKIILPTDWVEEKEDDSFRIMDIGPKTIDHYQNIIAEAKTVFWNGDMGVAEIPRYSYGTKKIAEAIVDNQDGYTVAAGGDTIAAIRHFRLDHGFNFISTGGGATLAYLAGEKLPGLEALGLQ